VCSNENLKCADTQKDAQLKLYGYPIIGMLANNHKNKKYVSPVSCQTIGCVDCVIKRVRSLWHKLLSYHRFCSRTFIDDRKIRPKVITPVSAFNTA